jgi:hypothetical protein
MFKKINEEFNSFYLSNLSCFVFIVVFVYLLTPVLTDPFQEEVKTTTIVDTVIKERVPSLI